jgi:D-alanyl-lipoteichoic acid acyltransferase DltB (MBOAT superfamily)
MSFTSYEFILFALSFFLLWPLFAKNKNTRCIFLAYASFFFYGWWDPRFLLLIIGSGYLDFYVARGMVKWPNRKRVFLILSIIGNIGSLAVFKYSNFMVSNINFLSNLLGISYSIPLPNLILPIGISFYTFQSMSYTFDVYKGKLKPVKSVSHFFGYLAMFPQLIAGPIIRAADLLPQLEEKPQTSAAKRWEGTKLITYGFFKKVIIADWIAPAVTSAFNSDVPASSCAYWWVIMWLFAFQIYCDFSGYTDIARGLARWMGYDFIRNFKHPYIASSFRDFWSRWHISLSTWFRDYVYIPLGGSRSGPVRAHINLWIAFLLSGLWHGAAWTFIFWAILHAFYLSFERLTRWPEKLHKIPGGKALSVFITFNLTSVAWVFFRSNSIGQAILILKQMFSFGAFNYSYVSHHVDRAAVIVMLMIIVNHIFSYLRLEDRVQLEKYRFAAILQPVVMGLLLAACVICRGPGTMFIYFQF